MEPQKELLAPCGLYCGVCGVLIATKDNNEKFRERLATVYGVKPSDIVCEGCLSETRFSYCKVCSIRDCVAKKGYENCTPCGDFPCAMIQNFPMPVGKKVILRAIPEWRELGTEQWVEAEEKRYHRPKCDSKLFRGTKRCRECGEQVSVD